jgi:hypothetical protein
MAERGALRPSVRSLRAVFESVEAFKHKPLDNSQEEIRLIRLTMNDRGHTQYTVDHFSLDTIPPYYALSYMWGTKHQLYKILIDGHPFTVRKHLFAFLEYYKLQYIRRRGSTTRCCYLWVDQICIDQSSIAERNHQVGLMGRIYSGAKDVLVWLNKIPLKDHNFSCPSCQLERPCNDCKRSAKVACHPYWQRQWIIQEVLLARSIEVLLEEDGYIVPISWVKLMNAASRQVGSQCRWLIDQRVKMMTSSSTDFRVQVNLSDALRFSGSSACSDIRDKVYALQSILPPDEQVEVDYNKPHLEVFLDAAVILARTRKSETRIDTNKLVAATFHLGAAMGFYVGGDQCLAQIRRVITWCWSSGALSDDVRLPEFRKRLAEQTIVSTYTGVPVK